MKVGKKDKETIVKALSHWKEKGLIDESLSKKLNNTLQEKSFNWKSLTFYAFIFALVSLVIAVLSIFADKELLQLIDAIIETSYTVKSIAFALITAAFYLLDIRYTRGKIATNKYSKELFALLAAISFSITIGFLAFMIGAESNPGFLILIASAIYLGIAFYRKKEMYWLFGLIALIIAYGAITVQYANASDMFLGMNIIMRFTLFSAVLLGICRLLKSKLDPFYHYTYSFLLVFSFVSLWLLSISGNYSDYNDWMEIRQYQLWFYSLILLIASIAAIVVGIKQEDNWLKNTGIVFVFLNLYTRYFEYFWDSMHKALFFALIAISFWVVGKQAEKIWSKED